MLSTISILAAGIVLLILELQVNIIQNTNVLLFEFSNIELKQNLQNIYSC